MAVRGSPPHCPLADQQPKKSPGTWRVLFSWRTCMVPNQKIIFRRSSCLKQKALLAVREVRPWVANACASRAKPDAALDTVRPIQRRQWSAMVQREDWLPQISEECSSLLGLTVEILGKLVRLQGCAKVITSCLRAGSSNSPWCFPSAHMRPLLPF